MDGNLKKLLFFGTLCSVMKLTHQTGDIPVLHEFLSISGLKKTWTEAQEFCKAHYSELATVFNMEEVDGINSNNEDMPETLWIGLYDPIDSWTWTTEAMLLDFGNWEDGEPDNEESNEHCVVMTTQGFWKDRQCGLVMPFICYTGTGYMMVTEEKPHPEASIYCKEHHTYMATILNSDDNQDVLAIMQAYQTYQEAWIGLRRDNWKWIDDSNSLFRHWGPNQPDNRNNNEACAIVTPEGTWNDTKCNEEHGFICQEFTEVTPPNETTEENRKETSVKLRMLTASDLRDPTNANKVLEQLEAALRSLGFTDFSLLWRSLKLEPQQTRTEPCEEEKKTNKK